MGFELVGLCEVASSRGSRLPLVEPMRRRRTDVVLSGVDSNEAGVRTRPADVDRLLLRRYRSPCNSFHPSLCARPDVARKAAALRRYFLLAATFGCHCRRPGATTERTGRRPPRLPAGVVPARARGTSRRRRHCRRAQERAVEAARPTRLLEFALRQRAARRRSLRPRPRRPGSRWAPPVTVWGKGSETAGGVPVGEPCVEALAAYLERGRPAIVGGGPAAERPRTALFLNARFRRLGTRDVRRILDRRSPVPTHPHALRHSYARPISSTEAPDLRVVQELPRSCQPPHDRGLYPRIDRAPRGRV